MLLHRYGLILAMTAVTAQEPAQDPAALPFRDPSRPVAERVADLVGRLTRAEKISLMSMDSQAVSRLGIPAYHWWNEGLHGFARSGTATVFPQAIALAATWNPELHRRIGDVVSTEARAKYNEATTQYGGRSRIYQGLTIWSPNINIFRDPRWGRGQETYGEDPFLTGTMGTAFVRGVQGNHPQYLKAVATLKHFAVHSGPEKQRHVFDAKPSAVDLHETYLPAFEQGIREGGARSVMAVYNAIDGVPGSANTRLLDGYLRRTWGFAGAVVGDVDSVSDVWSTHHYAKDAAEASALAIKAGNDLCSGWTFGSLPEALDRGLLTEADLDRSLSRLLELRVRLGMFDPPEACAYSRIAACDTPEHDRLALEAARQSAVLLKNDGTLPWNAKAMKTLAVIGPVADSMPALLGNYEGTPSRPIRLIDGLRKRLEPLGVRVLHEPGTPIVEGHDTARPVPADTLFRDASLRESGLTLEVFDNPDLAGTPVATKRDTGLARVWNTYNLAADVPERRASLRWSGMLVPKTDGELQFGIWTNSGFRFSLGEAIAVDHWTTPEKERGNTNYTAKLEAGQPYPIRFEYTQGDLEDGTASLSLRQPTEGDLFAKALAAAKAADHILLALGLTPQVEGEEMSLTLPGFDGGDRTSIRLPEVQARLLAEVSALGKPVVVVLTTGSAIAFDVTKANAALCAWYYGQNGGQALTEILLGETNPSGRLPVTFYADDADLPEFTDYSMARRTYRYFAGKPLFAFGHGLSYTTFAYDQARATAPTLKADGHVGLRVRVTNTGTRAGDEVVQVYARDATARPGRPIRQLVGFQRVTLAPGACAEVEIPLPAQRLRRWDETSNAYVVEPGNYRIELGAASDRILATVPLSVQ